MTADRTPTSEGPRFGQAFGKIMQKHPTADARLVNDILREAWEAAASPEERGGGAASLREDAGIRAEHIRYLESREREHTEKSRGHESWWRCLPISDYHLWERLRATPAAPSEPAPLDVEYLRAKLLDQHPHSRQWIEEAFREAEYRARLQSTPTPTEEPT